MKFRFSIQQYQSDAVKSVTDVFKCNKVMDSRYIYDKGKINYSSVEYHLLDDIGYKNSPVTLSDDELLKNIVTIQKDNGLQISTVLSKKYGKCSLDVTMETGTGKTYVYIKTIYELNKLYGWQKFIIVVPSIAIREGVYKSFDITGEHFYGLYNKKVKYFIYDSKNLHQVEDYSTSDDIQVMIINMQAFAISLKEDSKNKEARIIYSKRDEFGSRRPIDVIKANNPIIILDEPQKMGGEATENGIRNFNPLFSISYSATHKEHNNEIYVLDAVDAYKQKLVKKIEVKGIKTSDVSTGSSYVYFSHIILSQDKPPRAKIEIEVSNKNKITKKELIVSDKSDLYTLSKNMSQYEGFIVTEIDPSKNTIRFTNNIELTAGSSYGDIQESDIRRIQIRETIISHFEKEEKLFNDKIKTLS
ncbi:MAG: DEAD/DEAH box helicase family protein, partial [Mucispirillum sp.]|nr:DEAD/DEAH box helicase family protein [Mucispirillum sp.]